MTTITNIYGFVIEIANGPPSTLLAVGTGLPESTSNVTATVQGADGSTWSTTVIGAGSDGTWVAVQTQCSAAKRQPTDIVDQLTITLTISFPVGGLRQQTQAIQDVPRANP